MRGARLLATAGAMVISVLTAAAVCGSTGAAATTARTAAPAPMQGFDAASAPSASQMQAWMAHSSYRAVGVYIPVPAGSDDRHDKVQRNLTKSWVSSRRAEGWSIIPIFLGVQAPAGCGNDAFWQMSVDPGLAYQQGRTSADAASSAVASLGMARAPVYYDMEAYSSGCSSAVRAFFQGWATELHAHGELAGVYGSRSSTMADVVGMLSAASCVLPDAVWPATDDRRDSVSGISPLPATAWSAHQRINQMHLGHSESHGGVTLSIDSDYVDGPVVGPGSIPTPTPPPTVAPAPTPSPSAKASTTAKPSTTTSPTTAAPTVTASPTTTPPPSGACVPGPPIGVSVTDADGSVTLHWTRPTTGGAPLTGFTVTNTATGRTYTAGPASRQRTIHGLTDGSSYSFVVTAQNAVGTSFPSWQVLGVPVGVPGAVPRPTATPLSRHRLRVTWTAPAANGSEITRYRIYLDGTIHREPGRSRSITFTGVTPGTHTVRVAANNGIGRGPSSPTVSVAVS